jgi:UDP:flavonoid glycosyltransferase YjiC (YdhE family)
LVITFAGGAGHAEPLVPVARAARAAGHTVAFSGRASVAADLGARGFEGASPTRPATAHPIRPATLGRTLDALRATPRTVRDAVLAVLDDPAYRAAARRLRRTASAGSEPRTR